MDPPLGTPPSGSRPRSGRTAVPGWWTERKGELETLLGERRPVCILSEEVFNDRLFEYLALEPLQKIFYDIQADPHPRLLEKVYQLGAGFRCSTLVALENRLKACPRLAPGQCLFAPSDPSPENLQRPFELECPVLLSDSHLLRLGRAVFGQRTLLIPVDVTHGGPAPLRSSHGQEVGLIWGMDPESFTTFLRGRDIRLAGFQLHTRGGPWPGPERMIRELPPLMEALSPYLKELVVLSFDCRRGPPLDDGSIVSDLSAMGEYFQLIQDASARFEIWVDLGVSLIRRSTVLLTRVTDRFREGRKTQARIMGGEAMRMAVGEPGARLVVANLSGPVEESAGLIPATHVADASGPALSFPAETPIHQGDILLIPGVCLSAAGPIPVHYLRARKMCPVRL